MRASAPIACTVLLLSACWSPPELGRPRTPLQTLQRPLAPDLTTAAFAARTRGLAAALAGLLAEPARVRNAAPVGERLIGGELRRAGELPARAAGLLHGEADRAAVLPHDAGGLLRQVAEPAGDRDHHLAATARLLGVDRRPLGEIDDQRHRTDPDDDRPEAGLWRRLVRRLRL
ncbi:MAG: hypothetical protein JNM25_19955 [Planctomycetes bacterium]|nr:hypothetical protein [Planctomycetota bacterium]